MTAGAGSPLGVLVANLGTPDAPDAGAVRRYLAEFLADRRVVPLPPLLWRPLLHGLVLRLRPARSARGYRRVWTAAGAPLRAHSERIRAALERELRGRGRAARVRLGMRYGRPSLADALAGLDGLPAVAVLPLYPQYAAATTASVLDALDRPDGPRLRFLAGYAGDPGYLDACAARIREFRARHGAGDRLLLSFHGLPRAAERRGDPYAAQCRATARAIAARLGLRWDQWTLAFQSRFGPRRWLAPYTDAVLRALPGLGARAVDVFCPGFAADCLETLDEIDREGRAAFAAAGGAAFRYIPALNDHPAHVRALADRVLRAAA